MLADLHRSRLREQRFAFAALRGVSFLSIAILALIVGFVLVRGLRYSNTTRSAYLPYEESSPDGLAIVVRSDADIERLDFGILYGMFTDEYLNWSKISAEDLDLLPIAIDPATPAGAAAARLLFGAPEAALWGGLVATASSPADALARVAVTPGAISIVPAKDLAALPAGAAARLKAVSLRRIVIAANPEVTALVDDHAVEDLDTRKAPALMRGSISNWKELGGPDLSILPLAAPEGSPIAAAARAAGLAMPALGPAATESDSMDAYVSTIASSPGAIGYLFAADATAAELPALTLEGRESGWNLSWRYLVEAPRLSGKVGGISTIIANTFFMLLLTIAFAMPIGVGAAVYLVEYSRQGTFVSLLRLGAETLAGIPSILFGLFGMLFFVEILGFGFGLLSGSLTLTLMILPTIVRTSEEALKAVPGGLREGSLALGATKLQTVLRVVLPAAMPGILTGLILGIGRAVGETAALLFTMGSDYKLAKGLHSSARSLSAHVYLLFAEGISFDRAFSTATVLVVVVLAFNLAAKRLVGRMGRFAER